MYIHLDFQAEDRSLIPGLQLWVIFNQLQIHFIYRSPYGGPVPKKVRQVIEGKIKLLFVQRED